MPLLKDGYRTLVSIGGITAVFEEISVTPPALDSGGGIDQTTMRNSRYRTKLGKSLITLDTVTLTVAYDPRTYAQVIPILGSNRAITITFPEGSTLVFYAIVSKFDPGEHAEGERPEATLELEPSNLSTAATPLEIAPVFATGTTATTATTALPS
jgi:hypothetical protein